MPGVVLMRRGQIQMFETIGVLIVFFFLLVAGAAIYFNIQASSLQKELQKQAQSRSLQAAQRAMFLPELDCSFVSVQRENCFDILKLTAFPEVLDEIGPEAYFRMFGFATINVTEIYPEQKSYPLIYDNPPDEYFRAIKSRSPVILYDPVLETSAFGLMEVTTYSAR